MRTTLLTSLLDVVAHNRHRGVEDVSICDLGRVYRAERPDRLPEESQHLGIAGTGIMTRARWAASRGSERWDFYHLKGVVENLLLAAARTSAEFAPERQPWLMEGRAAAVILGEDVVGHLGELRREVRAAYDLPDPVFVAELDLELVRKHARGEAQYQPVSRFPAVTRDIAFVLPRDVAAQRAEGIIRRRAGDDLECLSLFDAYQGPPLPEGYRNLAFSLTFRRADRTLTDQEVEAAMDGMRSGLKEELGARLRE